MLYNKFMLGENGEGVYRNVEKLKTDIIYKKKFSRKLLCVSLLLKRKE